MSIQHCMSLCAENMSTTTQTQTTRRVDTLVIGGGVSGSVLFDHLAKRAPRQHTMLLVEARERFGGRSCTEKEALMMIGKGRQTGAATTIDTGGQWLGTCHTKMLSLCTELGLEVEEQFFPPPPPPPLGSSSSSSSSRRMIELAYYTKLKPLSSEAVAQIDAFRIFLHEAAAIVSAAAVDNDIAVVEEAWDKSSVLDMIVSRCTCSEAVEELSLFVQTVLAVDASDVSFLFFLHYVFLFTSSTTSTIAAVGEEQQQHKSGMDLLADGPDGLQALKVKGGMQQLCDLLVNRGLQYNNNNNGVLGDTIVTDIAYDYDAMRVVVSTSNKNNATIICRRVVLAMSPCLFYKSINFGQDLLSQERIKLYSALRPGSAVKVIVVFKKPIWKTFSEEESSEKIAKAKPNVAASASSSSSSSTSSSPFTLKPASPTKICTPTKRTDDDDIDTRTSFIAEVTSGFSLEEEEEGGEVTDSIPPFGAYCDDDDDDECEENEKELLPIRQLGIVSNIFVSQSGQHPALVCLITGACAREYSSDPVQGKELVLRQLQSMYRRNYTAPIAYIEKDWTAERFSCGCYASLVAPSQEAVFAAHKKLLYEPILPERILLAGTEASTSFYGYLEGAARRGEQVGEEILALIAQEDHHHLGK